MGRADAPLAPPRQMHAGLRGIGPPGIHSHSCSEYVNILPSAQSTIVLFDYNAARLGQCPARARPCEEAPTTEAPTTETPTTEATTTWLLGYALASECPWAVLMPQLGPAGRGGCGNTWAPGWTCFRVPLAGLEPHSALPCRGGCSNTWALFGVCRGDLLQSAVGRAEAPLGPPVPDGVPGSSHSMVHAG